MTWRERLLRWLRVPHAPAAPAGDEDVHVFRAARNFLRYRMVRWGLANLGAAVGLAAALAFTVATTAFARRVLAAVAPGYESLAVTLVLLLEIGAVTVFILQAIVSLILLRLDFEQRWYLVSDRSIRIREGLVRLHEKTMTLANVQHVSVSQGPLQRLLGIADVQIRSAGGGSAAQGHAPSQDMHIAWFRGVAGADLIRTALRERLRAFHDAGLGDPDDVGAAQIASTSATAVTGTHTAFAHAGADALLAEARALLEEARLLHRSVGDRGANHALSPATQLNSPP